MQVGYVLYDPENLKVLCFSKGKRAIELVDIKDTEKLSRALWLKDRTSIKDLYERFKKKCFNWKSWYSKHCKAI